MKYGIIYIILILKNFITLSLSLATEIPDSNNFLIILLSSHSFNIDVLSWFSLLYEIFLSNDYYYYVKY